MTIKNLKFSMMVVVSALLFGAGAVAADKNADNANPSDTKVGTENPARTKTGTEVAAPGENMPAENMGMTDAEADKMPGNSKDMVGGPATNTNVTTNKMAEKLHGEKLSQGDINTLNQIHAANLQEIKAGQLAEQKAANGDVKSYGKKLAVDHKKADDKIQSFAKTHNFALQNAPAPKNESNEQEIRAHNRSIDKLQSLNGEQFDREFLSSMEQSHADNLKMVKDAYESAPTGQYKSLLGGLMTELNTHHNLAARLEKKFMKPQK